MAKIKSIVPNKLKPLGSSALKNVKKAFTEKKATGVKPLKAKVATFKKPKVKL